MFSSLARTSSATVLTSALVLSSAALASAAPAPTEPGTDPTPASSSYSPFDEPDKSIAFYVGTAAFEGFEAQIVTEYSNEQSLDGLQLGNYRRDEILDR